MKYSITLCDKRNFLVYCASFANLSGGVFSVHKTDPKQCTWHKPSHSPSPPTLFLACYSCDLCALHTKDCALKTFASHTKVVTSALNILRSVCAWQL